MQDFQFEAQGASFPIIASRWQGNPYAARIFFQNEKATKLFGNMVGELLVDLFSEVIRRDTCDMKIKGSTLMKRLLLDGRLNGIPGTLASKHVELFSTIQNNMEKTIQSSIFDVTDRFMDFLTGITGRELFYNHLDIEMFRAMREKSELHVCFLNLDGFKQVNDLYGHKAGDDVLIEVAKRLRSLLRRHEIVARFSGDEFVLLLSAAHIDSLDFARSKLIPAINKPYFADGHKIDFIGVSVGISYGLQHSSDTDDLINHADDAMCEAKTRGKNQVVVFEQGMEGTKKH